MDRVDVRNNTVNVAREAALSHRIVRIRWTAPCRGEARFSGELIIAYDHPKRELLIREYEAKVQVFAHRHNTPCVNYVSTIQSIISSSECITFP